MNKTKTFSMFLLAGILVAGTISMAIPKSFAIGFENSFAKDYKKHGSNVNIQKAKCNNIIINGVDKSGHETTGEDMLGNAMAAEQNDVMGQQNHGFDNGEKKFKGFDRNIVNVCINKNNIVAVGEDNGEVRTCEQCWEDELTAAGQFQNLENALQQGFITLEENTPRSLDQLCDIFEQNADASNLENLIQIVLDQASIVLDPDDYEELVLCIAEALGIELPPG